MNLTEADLLAMGRDKNGKIIKSKSMQKRIKCQNVQRITHPNWQLKGMNKLEYDYSLYLETLKRAGEIIDYMFEPMKLILVHGIKGKRNEMSYKPDFMVIKGDCEFDEYINETVTTYIFEFHETKGFWREDAKLKIKMAAELFPWFKFVAIKRKRKKDGGGWEIQEF